MKKNLARALPATLLALPASWAIAQAPQNPPATVVTQGSAPATAAPAQAAGQAAGAKGAPEKAAPAQVPTTGAAGAQTPGGQTPVTGPTKAGAKSTPAKGTTKATTGKAIQGKGGGKKATTKGPSAPPAAKPGWQQFPLNPTTTMFLDFTESNPDAVFSLFSRTSGITILKSPQFKTPITLTSAKAVKLDEAFTLLNTVLSFQNYELRKQGNFLLVAMKQPPPQPGFQAPPPPPQPVVKTYVIQNAKASDVAKVVTDIYAPAAGGGGGQPQGGGEMIFVNGRMVPAGGVGGGGGGGGNPNFKITSDDYSNSVVVKAMPDEQTKIEALIKDLDKSTAQPLVSELFELKYVPADQAVTAIEDVLTANAPLGRGAAKQTQQQPDYGYYSFYGSGNRNQRTAGGQSATAIKATNSVTVNATKENMELIRKLLKNLDQAANFVDTTNVIKLQNAKATDVADLLTKVFTQQRNPNGDFGFFSFYDPYGSQSNQNKQTTDYNENGEFVNVRDITGKVQIQADPNTNSIVVVTQPSNLRAIRKVVEQLDALTDQVVIETVVVEANLDRTTKLGVEYNFVDELFGGNGVGGQDFGLRTGTGNNAPRGATYTLSGNDYRIFLNAVQTDSRFKVLDTPRIFTSNNVKSTITVGQSVPYPRSQNATLGIVTTNVDFADVAVVLEVTPRITANGQVTMDVVQSADDLQELLNFNGATAPLINKRKATTTVSVKDGATVVLGGIIQNTERRTDSKVPVLGDIPVLGQLFRGTTRTKGQSELMVFLTPHIIRNNDDAQRQRQKDTDDLTKPSQDSLKKIVPPR